MNHLDPKNFNSMTIEITLHLFPWTIPIDYYLSLSIWNHGFKISLAWGEEFTHELEAFQLSLASGFWRSFKDFYLARRRSQIPQMFYTFLVNVL